MRVRLVAVMLGVVMIVVVMVIMVMIGMRPRPRLCRDQKTAARQRTVAVRHKAAVGARPKIETRDGSFHGTPVTRKRVQERGHEHVARPAPEGVQMNVQTWLRPDNLRRIHNVDDESRIPER